MGKAPPDSPQYRDAQLGAEAKREELLNKARAELAAQPLEVRRVFVNRVSTTAAAGALAIGGVLSAMVAASPELYNTIGSFLPGRHPAVAASVLGSTIGLTVLIYFVARAFAEEFFTRAMLRTANPSADTWNDLERLRHTPTREALRLARRAHFSSRLALMIGFATIAAPLAIAAGAIVGHDGWLNPGSVDIMLGAFGTSMMQAAFVGCAVAALVAHYTHPGRAAIGIGSLGLAISTAGGGLAIWGVMLLGMASELTVSALASTRQSKILAAADART